MVSHKESQGEHSFSACLSVRVSADSQIRHLKPRVLAHSQAKQPNKTVKMLTYGYFITI